MSCPRVIGCVNTGVGQAINTRRLVQMATLLAGHSLHPDYAASFHRKRFRFGWNTLDKCLSWSVLFLIHAGFT
ncbi:hypothetical protein BDFB_011301 [Asbolus verrucosus]|uniref:Uncharacterized protein n=1 Tax=Asbolus verrucosus TaxID=1661398 RepID=A0A482VJV8_ASBVE|nr:hypothetical protein BDFB_011301 [Asbolus verrucosus]